MGKLCLLFVLFWVCEFAVGIVAAGLKEMVKGSDKDDASFVVGLMFAIIGVVVVYFDVKYCLGLIA